MHSNHYNIAIIGAGAAGLHLALAMCDDLYFKDKRILIIEKSSKDENDRTYCYWEKDKGLWDSLLRKSWDTGDFFSVEKAIPLSLAPYKYKMLRAIDFYTFAKTKIASNTHIHWINDDVKTVENGEQNLIKTANGSYSADLLFDSRIPTEFANSTDKYTRLLQHFKGYVIRCSEDHFDANRFTMMDFRLLWPNSTSFTYVLPLSKREALVEFTLFSPTLLNDSDYDNMLQKYISDILKLEGVEIIEQEKGVIPMSDFPFEKYSTESHIRIGTAGGWVKPSTGYSFKNCERNAGKIIANLKLGKPLNTGLISRKNRFYDSLFLDVLYRRNELGPMIFETLYSKYPVQKIFSFLDDKTNIMEDFSIMAGFPSTPFMHSFMNYMKR